MFDLAREIIATQPILAIFLAIGSKFRLKRGQLMNSLILRNFAGLKIFDNALNSVRHFKFSSGPHLLKQFVSLF